MRYLHPEAERPFRAPLVPLVPILGILSCLLLMFSLPWENWTRLIGWLLIGFVIYFGYGRYHSVLAQQRAKVALSGTVEKAAVSSSAVQWRYYCATSESRK
jgi:amino acid transporter